MALWDDIKRELANLWEILTTGEAQTPPEETPEEPDDEGGFFGGDEPPEEPPSGGGFFGDDDEEEPEESEDEGLFGYNMGEGPYPFDWGEDEIKFWDTQVHEHFFDNSSQYDEAQDAFYRGYMDDEISHEERMAAREEFLDITYFDDIDWAAFREYHGYDE